MALVPLPRGPTPDLQRIINDESVFESVEVQYWVNEQLIVLRAGGDVFLQSTKRSVPRVPTCDGKVGPLEVRRFLVMMLDTRFLDLPRNSYLMRDGDWQDWQNFRCIPAHCTL